MFRLTREVRFALNDDPSQLLSGRVTVVLDEKLMRHARDLGVDERLERLGLRRHNGRSGCLLHGEARDRTNEGRGDSGDEPALAK